MTYSYYSSFYTSVMSYQGYGLNPGDVHILFLTVCIVPMAVDTVKIVLLMMGVCAARNM